MFPRNGVDELGWQNDFIGINFKDNLKKNIKGGKSFACKINIFQRQTVNLNDDDE